MTIRKTGAVTGQVTEVEAAPQDGQISKSAGVEPWEDRLPLWDTAAAWTGPDDQALAAENAAADQE